MWWSVSSEFPWCAVAREEYAKRLEVAGLWSSAKDQYRAALTQDGSRVGLRDRLAKMDLQLEQYQEAYKQYQVLLAMKPDDSNVKQDVAMILTKIPDFPKQQELLKEASRQRRPDVTAKPAKGKGGPMITVGIADGLPFVTVVCRSPIIVTEVGSKKRIKTIKAGHPVTFKGPLKKAIRLVPENSKRPMTVYDVSHGGGQYWTRSQDRSYRGHLELRGGDQGLTLINRVSLEEYLYGVLPAEMGTASPMEALKAQAIIARSFTLRRRGIHARYDVCDDVHCAVYHGVSGEHPATNYAVDATRLKILMVDGKAAMTFFHDACGGSTRAPAFVWKGSPVTEGAVPDGPIPTGASPVGWLEWAVDAEGLTCAANATSSSVRWQRWYSMEELAQQLAPELPQGAELLDVTFAEPCHEGVVTCVVARTTSGEVRWTGDTVIRRVLGHLRGTVFSAVPRRVNGRLAGLFLFGRGWGHGVGLCQRGAMGLAKQGWSAEEIVVHYFPQFNIGRVKS